MNTLREHLAKLIGHHAPSTTTERLRPLPVPSREAEQDRADREREVRLAQARRDRQSAFDQKGLPRGLPPVY